MSRRSRSSPSSSRSTSRSLTSNDVVYNNDYQSDDDEPSFLHSYVVEVYSRDQLLATTSQDEQLYLKSRPGICAGMSLVWLQNVVTHDTDPRMAWPDVSYSRSLQEHIEQYYIKHHFFPEVGGMTDEGRYRFDSVDAGLDYVWNRPGSYMLLIRPRYGRVGHAVAYSDRFSWPNGYLMNPNKGNHCCYSFQALADSFRSDRFIKRSEASQYGPEFIIIRIGKKGANEAESDEEEDQVEVELLTDAENELDSYTDEEEEDDDDDDVFDEDDKSESDSDWSSSDDSDYYADYEADTSEDTEYVHYAGVFY